MKVHAGDVGTVLEITVLSDGNPLDISSATEVTMILRETGNGTGAKLTKTAEFTTDGEDGKMQYATVEPLGAGLWQIQGKIVIPQGTFFTDIASFHVEDAL